MHVSQLNIKFAWEKVHCGKQNETGNVEERKSLLHKKVKVNAVPYSWVECWGLELTRLACLTALAALCGQLTFRLAIQVAQGAYVLRSATHGDLQVLRTRTVTYGPQSFVVFGPTIWNTLPSTLRVSTTTLGQFQSGLKTILFRLAYGTWLCAFVTV